MTSASKNLLRLQKAWDTYNASSAYQQWRKGIQACPENHSCLLHHLDELRERGEATGEPDYDKIKEATEKWMQARDACPHCNSVQAILSQSQDFKTFRKTKRKLERRLNLSNLNVLLVEKETGE